MWMPLERPITRLLCASQHRSERRKQGIFPWFLLMSCLGLFSVGSARMVGSPQSVGVRTLLFWGPTSEQTEDLNLESSILFDEAETRWGGGNIHIVEDGDDLWTLASDYSTHVEEIVIANSLSYARQLRPGQQLIIPAPDGRGSHLMDLCIPRIDLRRRAEQKMDWPPLSKTVHTVQNGENLWDIARHYNIDVPTLFGANESLDGGYIFPGDEIVVPSQKGILVTVKAEKSLGEIADRYRVPLATVARANHLGHDTRLVPGQEVFVPGGRPLERGTFIWPLVNFGRVSSGFGYRYHPILRRRQWHSGIDLTASYGAPVKAARSGRVVSCGWSGGLGNTVVLAHDMKFQTLYGHCSKLYVKRNQYVKKGQVIASVGKTGRATGPHLHFEVHKSGRPVNPLRYLPYW